MKKETAERVSAIIIVMVLSELLLFVSSWGWGKLLIELRKEKMDIKSRDEYQSVFTDVRRALSTIWMILFLMCLFTECCLRVSKENNFPSITIWLFAIIFSVGAILTLYYIGRNIIQKFRKPVSQPVWKKQF